MRHGADGFCCNSKCDDKSVGGDGGGANQIRRKYGGSWLVIGGGWYSKLYDVILDLGAASTIILTCLPEVVRHQGLRITPHTHSQKSVKSIDYHLPYVIILLKNQPLLFITALSSTPIASLRIHLIEIS